MISGFIEFLRQYGIIGLAIAVIIGGKVNVFVTSLVNDLITPLILQPALNAANVGSIQELNFHGIMYGKVLGAGIDFFIVALLVYFVARFLFKEEKVAKR
jgi:large conductance mechanosensitive channel